jgi:hypothetical protein
MLVLAHHPFRFFVDVGFDRAARRLERVSTRVGRREMLAAAYRRRRTSPITQTQALRRATPGEDPLPHLLAAIFEPTSPKLTTTEIDASPPAWPPPATGVLRDDLATHAIC